MTRALVVVIAALALPAAASARNPPRVAPPGNSGVSQYLENVPTARGGQPTSSFHPGGPGSPGGSGGSGGSTGSGGPGGSAGSAGSGRPGSAGGSTGSGGAIPASTARAMAGEGAVGAAAAAVARATAPGSGVPGGKAPVAGSSSAPSGSGAAPLSSVFKALTGSASGGGLGALLPVILVVSLLAVVGLGLLRRRRAS